MRILVTVASRHGGTAEIANAIAAVLRGSGHEVEIEEPGAVRSLDGYGAVVLGSGVYFGAWLDPAKRFFERHRSALATRPTWLFSSGPIVGDPPQATDELAAIDTLARSIGARDHHVFGGLVDRSRLNFLERFAVSAAKAQDGDYRRWEEIRAWATGIARALEAGQPAGVGAA